MGQHEVEPQFDQYKMQAFMSALFDDLHALDYMIEHDVLRQVSVALALNRDVSGRSERAGADRHRGSEGLTDPRLTTEIAP
jgi:hypothetical protein